MVENERTAFLGFFLINMNRDTGFYCAPEKDRRLHGHGLYDYVDHSRSEMHIKMYDPSMKLGPESNPEPWD